MGYAIAVLVILWTVAGWAFSRTVDRLRVRMSIIERENLSIAKTVIAQKEAITSQGAWLGSVEERTKAADAEADAKIEQLNQRLLTLENKQPKIAPRPTRVNFRQFRAAMEASTEPQEAE